MKTLEKKFNLLNEIENVAMQLNCQTKKSGTFLFIKDMLGEKVATAYGCVIDMTSNNNDIAKQIAVATGAMLLGGSIPSARPAEHWKAQSWMSDECVPSWEQSEIKSFTGVRQISNYQK